MITRAKKKNLGFIGADNKIFTMADIKEESPAYNASNNVTKTVSNNVRSNNTQRENNTPVKVEQTVKMPNSDGYTPTNKKYGDYKYQDYANKKNYKIYEKDNKAYYYDEKRKSYVDMDQASMTSKEQDKKDYQEAVKQGFKGKKTYNAKGKQINPSKTSEQVALENSDLTKEEKEKYKKSLIKQEKQQGEELNYVRKSGTGLDAITGAWNNQVVNPNSTLQQNVINPLSNAGRIYESGKLNNELALEWYNKMQGKKNNAEELQQKMDTFNRFNQDVASGDVGLVGNSIQNLNTQVESIKNQGIAATAGGLVGGTIGGAVGLKTGDVVGGATKGFKLGSKAGYTLGSTPYMYKLEAGNSYKDLKELGVSDKKAKKVAKAVGTINAAIESGENVIDLLSFEGAGKIASNEVKSATAKKMKDEFTDIVETLGEKQAKGYLEKLYGSEIAENVIKSYGQNILSEALEEGTQETTSVLGERYATSSEGIKRDGKKDLERIMKSAAAGGGSALVLGIPTSMAGNATSYFTNKIQQMNEIQNKVKTGEISYEQANQQIQEINNDTYEQNRNLENVANQQVQQIQAAVQNGQMSIEDATQEIQAINNTLINEQEGINTPQNIETKTQNVTQETQSDAQEQVKEPIQEQSKPQEVYQEGRYKNLTEEDRKSMDEIFAKQRRGEQLNKQDKDTLQYLQRKNKGLKNPELKIINKFEDFSKDHYAIKKEEFKNFDTTALDNAEKAIQANKSGRRTKQQWLDIAENIGSQLDNVDSDSLKKYAIESFLYAQPNQKQNLNRQSQGYVDFKEEEWVNAVYKGAKVGQKVQQEIKQETQQVKEPNIAEQKKENVLEIPKEKVVQTGKEGEKFFEKQGAPKEVAKILSERPRPEKPKLKERIKAEIDKQKQYIKDFRRQFVDKGQEIYDVGKKTKNDELYASYDFAGTSESNGQYQIGKGQTNNEGFLYKNFTDKDGNKVSMSLEGMWKDIDDRGYGGVMDEYIGHYLNTDIYGKPTASSQKDINAIMDQVASGFMTPEDAEKAIDASTKIQSVFGEGVTKEDSLKRIKEIEKEYPGIKKAAENVWQFGYNMLDNMVDAGLVSQREAKQMKKDNEHYVRLQRNVEEQSQFDVATDENSVKVKSPIQERKGGTQDIIPFRDSMADYVRSVAERKRMNKIGVELAKSMKTNIDSNIDDKVIDETGFTFGDALKENENGTYTLKYFDKGKPKQLVINKGIYEALQPRKNFEFEDWAPFKLTGKASKIQRDAITGKNLLFSANNVPKDLFNAIFSTKNSLARFGKNYFKAIPQLLTNGEYAQRYQALGGNQNTYYNYEEGYIKDKSKIKALKAGQTIINGIERINNFFEQVPRVAEFMSSLENGKSVEQAMYDAAEVTTNFKRGGDVAKAVDRIGANYFNPSIQGASKFVRNFTEAVENKQYAKILTRTALLGIAPAILGELMWGDDDEYKELPDYQKDNYFLFKKGNGDWIRIPKGQVQGALQSLPRRAFTASRGQKNVFAGVGDAFAGVGDTLKNNVAPNNPIDDSVIGPFIAVARNKAWSGNPIVSDYLKNEDYPEDEYTSKTDEFSKWLGKKLHKSPAKINYLLDQYTGGIGDFVLPNLTKRTTKENTSGINAITNPLKDKFITNTTYSNKAQSDFYDALNHAENAKKHYGNNSEQALEYKYLSSVSQKISEKRKELEEIQSSNAPRKEKYEKAKELQDEMNKMARDAVKVKPKKEDGAISFGGTLYYKDGNEYKKASDKDEQKREFSGMSISDYYRSKIEQQKENKAAKEEKEKTKQSALSAFDLKEKDYDKYQYNISQFKADKDSEGKTIRGSKKDKVIDYVEGLPISDVQKAILIKGEGLSYKKYDDAIEDWLNSSKLNDDEKQKVKDYYKIK